MNIPKIRVKEIPRRRSVNGRRTGGVIISQQVDLHLYKFIGKMELLEHIERHGVEWWARTSDWLTANR